jgi:tRNA(Ile)-lysidine synthase
MSTYARWSQWIRRSGWLHAGDRVGVAVSGGADSVLLLEFMTRLAPVLGLVVSAVHFNHHLRGKESDEDEKFVERLAERLGVEFIRGEADVARRAREKKRNLEATAREMRYRFFASLVRSGRLDKVATAHTANDQAETVLLRLLRGAGAQGQAGIYPVLDGIILRPFLNLTRAEIEDELAARGLEVRHDSTNLDVRFRRNKIRHELLPQLERDFNPHLVSALAALADRARDDEEYLKQQAQERAAPWRVCEAGEEKFPARVLAELPRALGFRVIRQMIQGVRGRLGEITYAHLESVLRLAREAQSGQRAILPGGFEARREFEWLIVGARAPLARPGGYSYTFRCPADISLPDIGLRLRFKIVAGEKVQRAYNEKGSVYLDAARLADELELRSWRPGDCYIPVGARKPLKLKELFRARKIAARARPVWPVLVSKGEIIWVRGLDVAQSCVPGRNSESLLVVQESPGTTGQSSQD